MTDFNYFRINFSIDILKDKGCLTPTYCADADENNQTGQHNSLFSCDYASPDDQYCRLRCDTDLCNGDEEWGNVPLSDELTTTTTPAPTSDSACGTASTFLITLSKIRFAYLNLS